MCICGLHVEEGLMVQCGAAGCGVWQHARCVRVRDLRAPHRCHVCAPPPPHLARAAREIPLDEYTDDGHQFYLSLMRGDLQVRQGDTVYVLRDIPIDDAHPDVSRRDGTAPPNTDSPRTKRLDRKKLKAGAKGKDNTDDSAPTKVRLELSISIFKIVRVWRTLLKLSNVSYKL